MGAAGYDAHKVEGSIWVERTIGALHWDEQRRERRLLVALKFFGPEWRRIR
jgi:hypothetical protein